MSTRHIVCPHCQAVNRIPSERLGEAPKCGKCHEPLFDGHPAEIDAEGFRLQVARSDVPVVVDFWAPWCGPCRMMAPEFERAAGELATSARLLKLNTDSEQELAAGLGIRGIPTMILFVGGQEVARRSGAMRSADIVRWVQEQLEPA